MDPLKNKENNEASLSDIGRNKKIHSRAHLILDVHVQIMVPAI